jgi:hypothetical protein
MPAEVSWMKGRRSELRIVKRALIDSISARNAKG